MGIMPMIFEGGLMADTDRGVYLDETLTWRDTVGDR